MKSNGVISRLLQIRCANDAEYGHRVVWPLLDYLGIPQQARRPEFQIENPLGKGLLRLDFLIHDGSMPLVTIESEPKTTQFGQGFREAVTKSRNFKPRSGSPIQERTVPFLITAAGNRAEMHRAVVRGLNIKYEPIRDGPRPAFLEWGEMIEQAGQRWQRGSVSAAAQTLVADTAKQFFTDLFAWIDEESVLRGKDDEKIILFNKIIDFARCGLRPKIIAVCKGKRFRAQTIQRLLATIALYRTKIESDEFKGAAVARGYRTFLLQPGGRGAHRFFTGESQSRPYIVDGKARYRNVARYFTPLEIVQQMVRLANPRATERVIDMTCGTGGFLAECVTHVARREGEEKAQGFLTKRLVGIDDDPFCVSCARELLTFLYPQRAAEFRVFLHNALYCRAPRKSEILEDPRAESHLRSGLYDLVIGNPPGNGEYSGSNRLEIERQWAQRFAHTGGGLMDHHCFIRRAVELARGDGGRVCLLVPEGLLTRDNREIPVLRTSLMRDCELRLVVTLPRAFKDNNARMAIVYLVRTMRPSSQRKAPLIELREKWLDSDGSEHTTNLFGELETTITHHLDAL